MGSNPIFPTIILYKYIEEINMSSYKTKNISNEGVGGMSGSWMNFEGWDGRRGDGGTEFIEAWGGTREGKSAI